MILIWHWGNPSSTHVNVTWQVNHGWHVNCGALPLGQMLYSDLYRHCMAHQNSIYRDLNLSSGNSAFRVSIVLHSCTKPWIEVFTNSAIQERQCCHLCFSCAIWSLPDHQSIQLWNIFLLCPVISNIAFTNTIRIKKETANVWKHTNLSCFLVRKWKGLESQVAWM